MISKPRVVSRQGRRRRRIAAASAVLMALLVVFIVSRPHERRAENQDPKAASIVHRAASLTRFSGARWTPAQAAQLKREITAIAGRGSFPTSTGIIVADARTGSVIYEYNPDMALVPGSTIKLITAAAALEALGAAHRFVTTIVTDASVQGGMLDGNVWLVGGGDPVFTSDDLRRAARVVALAGVDRIAGNVYADGSRYGPDRVNASWLPDDLQYGWAAPASAITLDGGSIQFTITPIAGSEANVAVDPPGAADRVIASVTTAGSDAENTLHIDALPNDSGYEVRGQIPYGAPQKYWRSLPHPTRAAAMSLMAMLRTAGISASGYALEARAPAKAAVLWRHQSAPLAAIVHRMFFDSDNHIAEELLRAVGWQATKLGTIEHSTAAEEAFLQRVGLPHDGIVLADGSGLSDRNRVSARLLEGTLRLMITVPLANEPQKLLPRAGIEGTVRVRHLAPEAKGRVYAKDGYIEGASGLAGYVLTAHHGPVVFAFVVNNWEHGLDAVWADENEILERIAIM